jgi:UPF0716 protein FxsA
LLRLLLLMTLFPVVETAILVAIGAKVGPLPTFALVVGTGLLGATFAKREGLAVLRQLGQEMSTGLPPAERLVEGALVAMGGLLLITPGVLSDLLGLALVIPWTRRAFVPRVLAWARRNVTVVGVGGPPPGAPRPAAPRPPSSPFDHPVA